MEEGVRTFINGVLGQGTFDKLPTSIRAAMMDNAQELKDETLSPGYFSTFSCEDAKKIKVPTLLLTFQRHRMQCTQVIQKPIMLKYSASFPGIRLESGISWRRKAATLEN